jgi:uncharacterized protein YcfJ
MKILSASLLAFALATASGAAAAQSVVAAPYDARGVDRYGNDPYGGVRGEDGYYDYARVVRVVRVGGGYGYPARSGACRSRDYSDAGYSGYPGDDGYYGNGYYGRDGGYGRNGYYGDGYGSGNGRAVASVVGSVSGALVGSQVGGGSGRIATSAIGSAVGAIAGQQVYENAQRQRNVGRVTVCDPVPDRGYGYGESGGGQYDVTYEYGGRTHTTRTSYDPGERIRVRVSPE